MEKFSPKNIRIFKTSNLYLCFFVLGLCVAIPGPTLLDLQRAANTDTKTVAFVYTARSGGYLLGSLLGGVVFDLVQRKQFVLTAFQAITTVSIFAIPWSRQIGVLTAWMCINGISLGTVDTGGNVCCLQLWGKDSGPYYQALHLTFGVGGLVAPLVAAPFLSRSMEDPTSLASRSQLLANTSLPHNSSLHSLSLANLTLANSSLQLANTSLPLANTSIPSVTWAYAIVAVVSIVVTALFLVASAVAPIDVAPVGAAGSGTCPAQATAPRGLVVGIVALAVALLFVETGTEVGYAQMLTSYAVRGPLHLSAETGSFMTAAFWASFTAARLASVFLALRVSNERLLAGDLVVTGFGAAILLGWGGKHEWALWCASILLGGGIASFFPAAIGWMDTYFPVTNKVASVVVVGAALGEMAVPFAISSSMEIVPEALLYVVATSCLLSAVIVLLMHCILRKRPRKYTGEGNGTLAAMPESGATAS